MCSSCPGSLGSAVLSAPEPPRALGARWGHSNGRDMQPIPARAVTERLENKLSVVSAMENMQEHSFPQYTLALNLLHSCAPRCAPPPVPHAFGSQHSPSPICVHLHEQGDFMTFIPTINPHCLHHGTLQNSLQDHLDAEQM